jgi:Berberine and berberine like
VILTDIVRTHPAPEEAVQFSYTMSSSRFSSMADTFKDWQYVIIDPKLSRKLYTQVELTSRGMKLSGTFFGSEEEFRAQNIAQRFFSSEFKSSGKKSKHFWKRPGKTKVEGIKSWLALVKHWAGGPLLSLLLEKPSHFYHKSMSITEETIMSSEKIDLFFAYLDKAKKGTPFWFVIFDLIGGAVNDVPADSAAFPHRSNLYYAQSYAIQLGQVSSVTKEFIRGMYKILEDGVSTPEMGIYPGYVDPELQDAQTRYWGRNHDRLRRIKLDVDPEDLFHNPQSIRPADSSPAKTFKGKQSIDRSDLVEKGSPNDRGSITSNVIELFII